MTNKPEAPFQLGQMVRHTSAHLAERYGVRPVAHLHWDAACPGDNVHRVGPGGKWIVSVAGLSDAACFFEAVS